MELYAIMKYLALIFLLAGCQTQTTKCLDIAEAQYNEIVRRSGKENAQLWRLSSDSPSYTYHLQAKERRNGAWYWIPNNFYTVALSDAPQGRCKPLKRLK